jgi:hypothetical protein
MLQRAMRLALAFVALAACGDPYNGKLSPEQAAKAPDGHLVVVVGTVFTTTWDSTQTATRKQELIDHAGDLDWILEQGAEEERGKLPAYDDAGAKYPRTPDHYILFRTKTPPAITQGDPDFTPGALTAAWTLGVHLTDIDPATPLPEIGTSIEVTGTIHHVIWNQREVKLPIIDDPTVTILDGPEPLAGPGDPCTLDQECNARLVCDRPTQTCMPPPREIYWSDPWRDVNGACDSDADCPLGQLCDTTYTIPATGMYAANYFAATDDGRHLCRLVAGATVASQCPRIYTTRDVAGGRFATGKEICVDATLLTQTPATDRDTHNQMHVDEPIPYPTDDAHYELFGATTENGPIYKNPALPGGPILDPVPEQRMIAIGTYRYDPDHGWYEVHPVKAYLAPP